MTLERPKTQLLVRPASLWPSVDQPSARDNRLGSAEQPLENKQYLNPGAN